ncbi:MAG: DUF4381 family protein [Ignavibacteriales bacterium]|nr:DUF4381 family protein [Ignavibacteriales bacterium]
MRTFVLFLFGFLSSAFSQEVRITARTDSLHYRIGDWIALKVEAKFPSTVETITPAVTDSLGSFEVLKAEAQEIEPAETGFRRQWSFRLTTFDSGKGYIPPIDFLYRVKRDTTQHLARSNSLILDISSVAVDPQGDIRDIKLPLDAPWMFEDYLPYLIALAFLMLAGFGYYYWRKKQKLKENEFARIKPRIPPHQQALYELRELEDKKLWQQGKVKDYYSEVTEIIRRFFEGRWEVIALELTSDEILEQMKKISDAQKVWREMQSFFTTADLVKFAKYDPTLEEHEKELRWAYEIVRAMEPRVQVTKEEVVYAG